MAASSCYNSANEVHIKLRDAVIKTNTTLTFKDRALKTMFSQAGGGGSVAVVIEESKVRYKFLTRNL